jgi:hypothetical protein
MDQIPPERACAVLQAQMLLPSTLCLCALHPLFPAKGRSADFSHPHYLWHFRLWAKSFKPSVSLILTITQ